MGKVGIKEILGDKTPTVNVVDIGAMIEGNNRYDSLVEAGIAKVMGFEPEPIEFEKLKRKADKSHLYLPYFVGNGKKGTFHRCRYNGCSSLYAPDPGLIDLFTSIGASAGGNFEVVGTSDVRTVRLDDIEEIHACDFLKVDVQGAELDVLKGAPRTLAKTSVVELEVEFVPLYKGQPLFAEIDIYMRANGFLLHKLHEVAGRPMRPLLMDNNPFKPISQLLWANAVYIRDFTHFNALSPEMLLKTATVLHEAYSSIDMVALALKVFDAKSGTDFHDRYIGRVASAAKIEYSFMKFV